MNIEVKLSNGYRCKLSNEYCYRMDVVVNYRVGKGKLSHEY